MSEEVSVVFNDHSQVSVGDLYPYQPIRFLEMHLDDLLAFCVAQGASDIKIYSQRELTIKVSGKTFPVTDRKLTNAEVQDFVARLYRGTNGVTQLASGKDIDVPYEIRPDRFSRNRFRVSMTSMHVGGQQGVRITLRSLASIPPSVESMKVPQDLLDGFQPSNGMVLVTGPTGSGKSTLLAGIVRYLLEKKDSNLDILTYEAPIEFVYDEVEADPSALISQSEVPKDIRSFSLGVRNALRNNPDIILVGEARDTETLTAAVEASLTGHIVYSTVHSNDVPATIKRVTIGAADSGVITVADVIESLRMVVSQRLLLNPNGGRTAIREYKAFTQDDRDRLIACDQKDIAPLAAKMVLESGVSFERAAKEAWDAGTIYERDYHKIRIEAGL